jgi:hypothetical protein
MRTLLLSLFTWFVVPLATAAEPIIKHGVVLLQSSPLLEERVASIDAMAEYVRAVEVAAREGVLASPSKRPAAGFIVVAVKPGERARVWLDFDQAPNFQTSRQIVAKVGALKPFEARKGPVVFALKVGLWDASESRRVAPSPAEWKAATEKAGRQLELDQLVETVWPD